MQKKFDRLVARAELNEKGEIIYDNPSWVKGMLQQNYEPCKIHVLFERRKKSRSKEQMGYYWGVVLQYISEHTGHLPADLHDVFKTKFLSRKKMWRGTNVVTVSSTSDLSSSEMAEFITNVILEANELGIEIPPADPSYQWKL